MTDKVDFDWSCIPAAESPIWAQMPTSTWLDTAEGCDATLRPDDSPGLMDNELSIETNVIPKHPEASSNSLTKTNGSVEQYEHEYHKYKQGKYFLPNDKTERDRLDLQHAALFLLLHGRLSLAPLLSPKTVLDLGTGTGIWAVEFAKQHPDAKVIGTDLSPIQPGDVPANCVWRVEDAKDEWHFDTLFDYVHAHFVCTCFNDPSVVIQQAYENLEPGGFIEFQDMDSRVYSDDETLRGTELERMNRLFNEGCMHMGRDIGVTKSCRNRMIDAGFEDVMERKFKLPGNTWPKGPYAKLVGRYQAANIKNGAEGISMLVCRQGLEMSEAERVAMVEQTKKDVICRLWAQTTYGEGLTI